RPEEGICGGRYALRVESLVVLLIRPIFHICVHCTYDGMIDMLCQRLIVNLRRSLMVRYVDNHGIAVGLLRRFRAFRGVRLTHINIQRVKTVTSELLFIQCAILLPLDVEM